MLRLKRIIIITVAVVILAWVIKEVIGESDGERADDLIQKIRLSGI